MTTLERKYAAEKPLSALVEGRKPVKSIKRKAVVCLFLLRWSE